MTRLAAALLDWFDAAKRDLPWRRGRTPYRVWVAEVILQQTRAQAATPYFQRFVAAFPDVRSLARADEQRVLKLWEGLGYYRRAHNLLRAARETVAERGGVLPRSSKGWRSLPGIGDYTAAAIAAIANGERVIALDGNLLRVGARLFAVTDPVDRAGVREHVRRRLLRHVPAAQPGDFNEALMDVGAAVCLPRRPRCDECPVRLHCAGRRRAIAGELPVRGAKKAAPEYEVAVAIIIRRGRVLMQRRPRTAMLGGLWEFPGGKCEAGESPRDCAQREVEEELGARPVSAQFVGAVRHAYSHFRVRLHGFICDLPRGFRLRKKDAGWFRPADIASLPLPTGTYKLIAAIKDNVPALDRPRLGRT